MLRLLAVAPEDGWAFVERQSEDRETKLFLIRPPYHLRGRTETTAEVMQKSILFHGFEPEQRRFPQWEPLIQYLKKRVVEERTAHGQRLPDRATIAKLLESAPRRLAEDFLRRIESELLARGSERAAAEVLTHLLRADAVREDKQLHNRAVELLAECQSGIALKEERRAELVEEDRLLRAAFPYAAKEYELEEMLHYARGMSQPEQLLPF